MIITLKYKLEKVEMPQSVCTVLEPVAHFWAMRIYQQCLMFNEWTSNSLKGLKIVNVWDTQNNSKQCFPIGSAIGEHTQIFSWINIAIAYNIY